MRFFYLIGLLLIVILISKIIKAIKTELERIEQKREKEKQAEERERNWQAYKTKVPWRYCHDIDHIFSTYPSRYPYHNRISMKLNGDWDYSTYYYNDDILEIMKKVPDRSNVGNRHYEVKLKGRNIEVLSITEYDITTPIVYRPQGSTGWEDYLINLSEHIDEVVRQEKEEYEEGKRKKWNIDHSPLP